VTQQNDDDITEISAVSSADDFPPWCNTVLAELWAIDTQRGVEPSEALDDLRSVLVEFRAKDAGVLPARARAVVLLNFSSVFINIAGEAQDVDALLEGAGFARECSSSRQFTDVEQRQAYYNEATAFSTAADIRARSQVDWETPTPGDWAVARWSVRGWLVEARRLFRLAVGAAGSEDAWHSSMAMCNLANALDSSGRWVEAYDRYVHALELDPTNGNAAGNAAVLIGRAAKAGWGNRVHLYGLYDRYLLRARELRERTVQIAGEDAAQRYDRMKLSGGSHVGDEAEPLDPYQAWVLRNRLALTPELEGVGHKRHEWDDAFLSRATTPIESADPPAIFVMLNLVKADYLVARRLLYRAEAMLGEEPFFQHPDDPGSYMDTMDMAVYGEPMAMIVLAQRSALDVLDKLAVAVNEHFSIGVKPRDVYFSSYWTEQVASSRGKEPMLRQALLAGMSGAESCVLAMAELALDMNDGGMHEQANEARDAAQESLAVARAAYLYLVAGLEVVESNRPEPPLSIPVTPQRKAKYYLDLADDTSEADSGQWKT
jgi:tetratricopeptide (TPR) repeat protein